MAEPFDTNSGELQFSWGKKGGFGGANKEYQFYKSFTMDNTTYSLYDCVYLYKVGEPEPYIGKIIKLREHENPKSKQKIRRARILWYFRPSEIKNYLRGYSPSEKEIFLACGEGCGLSNYNPLEAIAGKCNVICTSKDGRNPQPSEEDLEMADYIFCCTFRVDNLTISQNIDDQIAGIEAKYMFNRIEDLKLNHINKLKENEVAQNCGADKIIAVHRGSKADSLADLETALNDTPNSVYRPHRMIETGKVNSSEDHIHKRKLKAHEAVPVMANNVDSIKSKIKPDATKEGPCKKMRLDNDSMGLAGGIQTDTESRRQMVESKEIGSSKDQLKPSNAKFSEVPHSLANEDGEMPGQMMVEANRQLDSGRSKWFKPLPWLTRLQKADEQGTLVLIHNLDPSYASSEIVGIIKNNLHQDCIAKVIPQGSFQNPYHGQAYAIFNTKDAANLVVYRINQGCLLQPNGSPLMCSKGMLKVPEQDIRGHLPVYKMKSQREEVKNAVSTSHCSQPNTIEFEMAMEWIVVHEKSKMCMDFLHKEQIKEQNQVKKTMKLQ